MSTSIHIPEGLHSFHISHTESAPLRSSQYEAETILLRRLVTDLQQWLNCSWAAGMIPSCSGTGLVPELQLLCVAGNGWRNQTPELICPVRNNRSAGLAAIVAL